MKVMLRYFAAIAATMVLAPAASAGLLTEWNFNQESSPGNASTGTGTSSGPSFPFTSTLPNNAGSSADPGTVISQGLNNYYGSRSSPAPGSASNSRTITFSTSTANHTNLKLEWDFVGGFRSSRYYQIQASTDGVNFSDVSGGIGAGTFTPGVGFATVNSQGLITVMLNDGYIPDPDLDPSPAIDYLFDLSYAFPSGSIYDDSADFAVRIGAVHAPGGSDFVSSFAGTTSADTTKGYTNSTSAGGGTVRYDLVSITGVVPEPTTLALGMVALAFLGVLRHS